MIEETVMAVDEVKRNRQFSKLSYEYFLKSREQLKPICLTCLRRDWDKSQVQEFDAYADLKQTGKIIKSTEKAPNGSRLVTGAQVDYECPKGHGVSYEWNVQELETLKIKAV